jgi:hypothetical protein
MNLLVRLFAVACVQLTDIAQASPALSGHADNRKCAALIQHKAMRNSKKDAVSAEEDVSPGFVSLMGSESGIGSTAPLNSEGYVMVANARDARQMESFMLRLISGMDLHVRDHGGLLGVIPFYDGEKSFQSFDSMKEELLRTIKYQNGWVTAQGASVTSILQRSAEQVAEASGSAAPLNEEGYHRVALLRSTAEMAQFVRRVVAELGLCVEDEGGLSGVALWYSGEKVTQSFAQLRSEVSSASRHDGTWVLPPPCK